MILIDRFDEQTGLVYFKYLGDKERNFKVRLHSHNLTLHYVEITLGVDLNASYFVGYAQNVCKNVTNLSITFNTEDYNQTFNVLDKEPERIYNLPIFETKIDDPSFYSFNEVFTQRIYEDDIVKINEGDVVVDIGANYGFFSLFAEEFNPSKIICFEPSKTTYDFLNKNFISGKKIQKAVSGRSGIKGFLDDASSSASSRLTENGQYDVEVIGINELHNSIQIEKIDFLKIDCEGAEKEIFEEITSETLSKINKLVVEFHGEEIKENIINKLSNSNFKIQKITSELIFAFNIEYLKNKKKIALISTYCDTQEKKDIFLDLVKKIKVLGIDVMAISPLPLEKEYIDACDYLFFTKENPILKWPTRLFTFWREDNLSDGKVLTMQRGVGDYSWAALYHVKKLTQFAMSYDYDIFYHMIYDLEMDSTVESALKNFEGNIVYPRRDPHHPETLWETTLHFMSFDKDLMKKIEKEITLESYLSTNGVAEGEVLKWKNKFNIKGSEHPVKDKIFYWKDYDFFDYSPVKDFKLFMSKNDEMTIWLGKENVYSEKLPNNLRIVFYKTENPKTVKLYINSSEYVIQIKNYEIIELPISSKDVYEFILEYDGIKYDLSVTYNDVMLNQIYHNNKN